MNDAGWINFDQMTGGPRDPKSHKKCNMVETTIKTDEAQVKTSLKSETILETTKFSSFPSHLLGDRAPQRPDLSSRKYLDKCINRRKRKGWPPHKHKHHDSPSQSKSNLTTSCKTPGSRKKHLGLRDSSIFTSTVSVSISSSPHITGAWLHRLNIVLNS